MHSDILKQQWRVISAACLSGFESKLPQQLRAIDRLEALPHKSSRKGGDRLTAFDCFLFCDPFESLKAVL